MSVAARYLEFDGVALDLRHVVFSRAADEAHNADYIIFLNVKKAMFANFNLVSDLSLESLALFVYENLHHLVDGQLQRHGCYFEKLIFNEHDRNKSIVVELDEDARLIVAAAVKPHEKYHQRIGGYLDFEQRHDQPGGGAAAEQLTDAQRAERDRLYEIKLVEWT
ncbi:LdOrf-60 peptide [Lymantria dispar multiple nucleopolyhedrovirus]|jgi:hypothetical protein|uniref:LdOrf-60 peptide n=1 Tax=Lymantria dispar multicapsid nuclear polyhedrosis virus TaxID=10449 RepID=Q9YMR4_NPVLD|nr:LdOrf-60 peptide [Lymantria dispar multiple nucleopolyhedrovirus]AAC70245.1 LdOrf-60 peptide [Lymantria dispar multiple nucleopolyhedrovirus]